MPAEWEPHASTWIAWPHNPTDWPGKFEPIPWVYAEFVRHVAQVERVDILVNHPAHESAARKVLRSAHVALKNIRFHRIPTNRGWTRDFLPTFVRSRSGVRPVKWRFNAWAKYRDWQKDEAAGLGVAQLTGEPLRPTITLRGRQCQVVMEGGALETNGRGLLLTTEECLLSPDVQQRNPGLSRADLERVFADYLGIDKVLWLERGIVGDDTHGHIDDIARFVGPRTIVTAYEDDPAEANHQPLKENFHCLSRMTDQSGCRLRIVKLPMPRPVFFRGQRLPASYANFYIANGLVLVPTFNDPADRTALNTLATLMPRHRIVPIYCGDLVLGLGTLHCMTQQQPAV